MSSGNKESTVQKIKIYKLGVKCYKIGWHDVPHANSVVITLNEKCN